MDINLELGGSSENLLNNLKAVRAELAAQKKELEAIQKANRDASQQAIAGGDAWIKKEMELNRQLETQKRLVSQLNKDLQTQSSLQDSSNKKYQEAIEKLNGELEELKKKNKDVASSNKEIGDSATVATRGLAGMIGKIASLVGFVPMIAAAALAFKVLREGATDFYNYLTKSQREREEAQKRMLEINKDAQMSIVNEKVALEVNIAIARDKTATDKQRAQAIKNINEQMPENLKGITQEGLETEIATGKIKTYLTGLDAKARGQAYMSQIQAAYNKLIEIENSTLDNNIKIYERIWNSFRSGGNVAQTMIYDAQTAAENQRKAAEEQQKIIENLTTKLEGEIKGGTASIEEEEKKSAQRRQANFKDHSDKIIALEKQLAAARIAAMKDGRQKEIAQEEAAYEDSISRSVNNARKYEERISEVRKSSKMTESEKVKEIKQLEGLIKLEYQNQEQLAITHAAKLLAIDTKYYGESEKALEESQKGIYSVILKDQDKEVQALNDKYEKLFKVIEEAKKKALEAGRDYDDESDRNRLFEQFEKEYLNIDKKYALLKLKQQEDLAVAEAGLLVDSGKNAKQIEEMRQREILKIQIDYAKRRIELLESSTDEEDKITVAKLRATIAKLENELNKVQATSKFRRSGILGLLGFDDATMGASRDFERAIAATYSNILDGLQSFTDERIKQSERIIQQLEREISETEKNLDREKSLMEQGYANNYEIEEQKLADLKRRNNEQLEELKRAQKEQENYAKAQKIIQGIVTSTKLGAAAAEYFASGATYGPIAGAALSIAAIAAMFATMASVKAQSKSVGDFSTFRHGGDFDATGSGMPTHERGGIDVMINGEKKAEFEKGEYAYFFKDGKTAKKFKPLFDDINNGGLSKWHVSPVGLQVPEATMQQIIVNKDSGSEKYLQEINQNVKKLAAPKTEREDRGNMIIERTGSHTRIIRK